MHLILDNYGTHKTAELTNKRIRRGVFRSVRELETAIREYIEVHKPVNEERRAVLEAKKVPALLPAPGSEDDNGVPPPSSRGMLGKARAVANRAFAETIPVEADGHGNGHQGNGHALTGEEQKAVLKLLRKLT